MPRSRTGCLTCRQRKLKCSEEKPVCAQCIKANRTCVPSSGITFRHQQNPSLNGVGIGESGLKRFYGYKETFDKDVTWVSVPRDLKFVNTINPYDDDDESPTPETNSFESRDYRQADVPLVDDNLAERLALLANNASRLSEDRRSAYPAYATQGLEALSNAASQDPCSYVVPTPNMSRDVRDASQQPPPSLSASWYDQHALSHARSEPVTTRHHSATDKAPDGNIDPRLDSHVRSPSYINAFSRPSSRSKGSLSYGSCIYEPELAFLLRDFSERAGRWMDLFDHRLFFATRVPELATQCPLLLYAAVACSAKRLARVYGGSSVGLISSSRRSGNESWPSPLLSAQGWSRKACEYYDLAVSLVRQALAGVTRPPTLSLPQAISLDAVSTAQSVSLPSIESDEVFAATAILCVYEFIDTSTFEWSRHLDGAKSLFDIANDSVVPLNLPLSPVSVAQQAFRQSDHQSSITVAPPRTSSQARRAVFWNFARQDMLHAFINNHVTRLDTSDLEMWRIAGLKLTADGFVCPSKPQHPDYTAENAMPDDLISNALIWLLQKLVNFIAAGDDVPEALSPNGLGMRQQELLEYWKSLDEQLRAWYEGLPDSFRPAAVTQSKTSHYGILNMEERWFARPMCASTMQSYHFARIQLLHNKPHLSTGATSALGALDFRATSLAARHASYATILEHSRAHAKEIMSIALGGTDEAALVHSVQPLWTAGLVLGNASWRRIIITQLRAIEKDTGWASDYRVQNLLDLWQLPPNWPGDVG
ncbi:hypothetical protein BAUCODRAFT_124270 [Baudoinia panamericana UAMH 10762]|uniref:Zn(2)-C6 fungal-type domain-containing protein n=1 Tax=Baudoinia panamericana (strain UAMH 10762) TaxID=717646 RepID=M2N796_BAUPA|nr:uncharacterized protein BAUCODRAFT_124270 [Baudoinia panamericana UAMH 10762]EMC94665.1 hypothetical protein BAUCODRAFT_124270 [Baudoinia panamericana UAMH 10762]